MESDEKSPIISSLLLPAAIGAAVSLALSFLLILLGGAILTSADDPDVFISVVSGFILLAAGAVGGVTGAKYKGGGFVSGVISGALFALILFVISLFFQGESEGISLYSFLMRILTLGAAALGAYISAGKRYAGIKRGVPRIPKIKR